MWYKVLTSDLKSAHGGKFDWSEYVGQPDKRTPRIDNVAICERGYHFTTAPMKWPVIGMRVFEAATDGPPSASLKDKGVWPTGGLGSERPELVPSWWHDVEAFVAELPSWTWMQPQGDPDPSWEVFPTIDEAWVAARSAARWAGRHGMAAWAAAWVAARDAACDAALVAARVAARDAAGAAAQRAAYGASCDAALVAARDAAGDARLWSRVLVCDGLPLAQRHIDHARARMDVWRRGYGLLCDVDGVLYVYAGLKGDN
jgi:hypothetical protein